MTDNPIKPLSVYHAIYASAGVPGNSRTGRWT